MPAQIPDRVLERYLVGALDPQRTREVEAARAADPEVADRLRRLVASNAEILATHPPPVVGLAVRARLDAPRRPWWPALALAVAAAGLLFVASTGHAPTERIKGGLPPQLHVYLQGERDPLRDGGRVNAGDVLQIAVVRGEDPYGAVLAIDGRGGVTVHASALPEGTGEVPLDQALVLDDAPSFERFFLVTCPTAPSVDALVADATALGAEPARARTSPLPTPPGCRQTSRLLLKAGP